MKLLVTFKDPDTLQDAIEDAVKELKIDGLSKDELDAVREKRAQSISELCSKWFPFGEYIVVEIDTEAKTCIVKEDFQL